MTQIVEKVVIGHQPAWGKWPDTQDTDYSAVMAGRSDGYYTVDGAPAVVRSRNYPVYRAYVIAGATSQMPVPYPGIDNNRAMPPAVAEAMVADLASIARECRICCWEHARNCYPAVAQHLKRLFAHSILVHSDDSPNVSLLRTHPVAGFFDSAFHGNIIWTPDGRRTAQFYKDRGVEDTQYISQSTTISFNEGLGDWRTGGVFDIDRRIRAIRERRYSHDCVFVGGCVGAKRQEFNAGAFGLGGFRMRLYGIGMRDGVLPPQNLSTVACMTLGLTVAPLYLDSFSTVNLQFIGLLGSRVFDALTSGTLLFMWDPCGELAEVGMQAGIHYAAYDGTVAGLIARVRYYQDHLDETERILRAGYEFGVRFPVEHSMDKALEKVLAANKDKWAW